MSSKATETRYALLLVYKDTENDISVATSQSGCYRETFPTVPMAREAVDGKIDYEDTFGLDEVEDKDVLRFLIVDVTYGTAVYVGTPVKAPTISWKSI